jgi:hypothetical protein
MNPSNTPNSSKDDDVWISRRKNNMRLAWVFGGLAFLIFLVAIWKYRPM